MEHHIHLFPTPIAHHMVYRLRPHLSIKYQICTLHTTNITQNIHTQAESKSILHHYSGRPPIYTYSTCGHHTLRLPHTTTIIYTLRFPLAIHLNLIPGTTHGNDPFHQQCHQLNHAVQHDTRLDFTVASKSRIRRALVAHMHHSHSAI